MLRATKKQRLRSLEQRFWDGFVGEPNSGCWLWMGTVTANGYGQIREDYAQPSPRLYVHRVSWGLHKGPIPNGLHVLHKCDTPACCNPAHLFLGTMADNTADKVAKGRQSRGSAHYLAKFTPVQIAAIRRSSKQQADIARQYGVAPSTICEIKHGKSYR